MSIKRRILSLTLCLDARFKIHCCLNDELHNDNGPAIMALANRHRARRLWVPEMNKHRHTNGLSSLCYYSFVRHNVKLRVHGRGQHQLLPHF